MITPRTTARIYSELEKKFPRSKYHIFQNPEAFAGNDKMVQRTTIQGQKVYYKLYDADIKKQLKTVMWGTKMNELAPYKHMVILLGDIDHTP